MEERHIDVNGIKLFYQEVNSPCSETIYFFHGNSSSHQTWERQLGSPLLEKYRLIAFDLPAHGLSDSASGETENYSLPGISRLMAKAVLQTANNGAYLLTGFSLGTNIISEMLSDDVQPHGLVLTSPCVVSSITDLNNVFLENPNSTILFQDEVDAEKVDALIQDAFFAPDAKTIHGFKNDFLGTKAPFRSLLLQSAQEGKISDELALLQKSGLALLVVFGLEEKILNTHHLDGMDLSLWRNKTFKLPDARHFVHLDQADHFTQLLSEYAKDCFKPTLI